MFPLQLLEADYLDRMVGMDYPGMENSNSDRLAEILSTTYTIAGVSRANGGLQTYRFANGSAQVRAAVLRRGGHTDIRLFGLPQPMNKVNAIKWLEEKGYSAILPEDRGAILDKIRQGNW